MKLKTFTLLFTFLIVGIIVLADRDRLQFLSGLYAFPGGDKVGHGVLYGILAFLLNLTFLRSLRWRDPKRGAWTISLLLALAIALEEGSQRFIPVRTADGLDLLFSFLGVAVGAWGAYRMTVVYKKE